jgi:hypothetical protein
MHLMIRDSQGRIVEGLLLAANTSGIRLQVRGTVDVTEISQAYGEWTLQTGEKVELEFLGTADWFDPAVLCSQMFPRAGAAGENRGC